MNAKDPPGTHPPIKTGEVVRLVPRLRIVPPLRSPFEVMALPPRHAHVPPTMAIVASSEKDA